MILGCDAAGVDEDGNEVIVHSVINDPSGTATRRSTRAGRCCPSATRARSPSRVAVPRWNLVPKPAELSFEQAACLPTAWLTAYRMLFTRGAHATRRDVLVQGASGGVATALTVLGSAAGIRVWVTGRSEEKRARALELGADQAFEPGARLPERVDAVMETDRPGDVGALGSRAQARRQDRDLGRHHRRRPAGRADPDLLPPAVGDRIDDGDPRGARAADPVLRRQGRAPGDQARRCP